MEDIQVKLKESVENKKLLDNQTLKIVSKYICKNVISPELLNLVLYYLEMYPHQISLIPKSNYRILFLLSIFIIIINLIFIFFIYIYRIIYSYYIKHRRIFTSFSFIFGGTTW